MPKLTRWAVKLSLIYFVAGILLGAEMLAAKAGFGDVTLLVDHRDIHIHVMLFGWMVQLAMGVAYWILPKFADEPRRGNTKLAVASVVALNGGVLLGSAGPWLPALGAAAWGLEALSAVLFAVHLWPRIKSFGR